MKKRIINGVKNGQSLCEYKVAHIVEMLRGKKEPTIIHTDQGSVYSSKAYNELIQDSNLVRSMAQAGKPTDNPVNEALNGWIKEELFIDFRLEECRTRDAVKDVLCRYVDFYNRQRPALQSAMTHRITTASVSIEVSLKRRIPFQSAS